jgi:hypothetical protein
VTGAAQRRQEVLERARYRRRRRAAEREQEPLRRAMAIGGTIGIACGVVFGQLVWVTALAGPAIAAVLGLGLGVGAGAGVVLERERAVQRAREREEARAREEERARLREEARRERREKRPKPAPIVMEAEGDFLVPPGFYPDPRGGDARRWWDGEHWTEKLQGAGET